MKPLIRFGLAGAALAGLVWCVSLQTGIAGGKKKQYAQVDEIAKALEKGDKASAEKLAKKLAKSLDETIHDTMYIFKPRNKQGVGIGKTPDQIVPDGIELLLRKLARDTISKAMLDKNKEGLIEMGYRSAAMAHVAEALVPNEYTSLKKPKEKWVEFSKEMNEASHEFVKAVKSGSPAELKKAASALDNTCNRCHSVFRD